jgi:hypothetical protein
MRAVSSPTTSGGAALRSIQVARCSRLAAHRRWAVQDSTRPMMREYGLGRDHAPVHFRFAPKATVAIKDVNPSRRATSDRTHRSKSLYSITSWASATTVGGSSSPIDFAVFKLITNR